MAIFGRWGRGKTFLFKEVARALQDDKYTVTWFNAWKFRTTPEVWAHLYETIVRSITQDNIFRKVGLAIRAQLVSAGIWSILGYAIVSYCLILPFAAMIQIAYVIASLVGVGFALYILGLMRKGKQTWSGFQRRFATLVSHQLALGLQAAIGDDLRNAVVGAFPNGYFKARWIKTSTLLVAIPSIVVSWAMFGLPEQQTSGKLPAAVWLPKLDDWQIILSVVVWWVIFLFFILCSKLAIPNHRRLLLIVDDLDRCDPRQMLEIIESIKLLIEDEHLDDRMQVVLLVEETLLKQAIIMKLFSSQKKAGQKPSVDLPPIHVLVDEHLDKLFLAYYRFPQLSDDELGEVADKFIVEQLREIRGELQQKLVKAASNERDDIQQRLTSYDELLASNDAVAHGSSAEPDTLQDEEATESAETGQEEGDAEDRTIVEKLSGLVYSQEEKDVLVLAMKTLPERLGQSGYSCSPRAVRLFLYRYQLVRLLLDAMKQGTKWTSSEVVETMMLAYQDRVPNLEIDWDGIHPQLQSIVKSVV